MGPNSLIVVYMDPLGSAWFWSSDMLEISGHATGAWMSFLFGEYTYFGVRV